jgi:signal transduction histidine kinase
MKPFAKSIARRLILVTLLTGGATVAVAAGLWLATDIGPGPFVAMLVVSTIWSTCAVWTVSKRLVTGPLHELRQTVQGITDSQGYSVRTTRQSDDDVGLLARDLNGLLSQMEERDRHYQGEGDRLEAEVAARTRELRESNQRMEAATAEAVKASKAKSEFIANMTHEIRTPMNGVLGMTELLFNTNLTDQQHKFIRTILESAEDLLSIINNILDFSKVEAGKLEKVDVAPFSPRECLDRVSDLLASRAELKGLTLTHEVTDDVPEAMRGDGKRLRQVLTNLIGNAIKFTERGTIVVRMSTIERWENKVTIRFEIVDTGVGIPSHLHDHVFEGFSQADTSTTRQFGGTGLGLAISKHLVELMGGQIGIISRPGVGSNFWFTVGGELYLPTTSAERDLGGIHALVAAVKGESRDAVRHQLMLCGGSATVAEDAEKTLEVLNTGAFDVLLIDTQGIDGFALAREIRSREEVSAVGFRVTRRPTP